jgi:hypothetical protein
VIEVFLRRIGDGDTIVAGIAHSVSMVNVASLTKAVKGVAGQTPRASPCTRRRRRNRVFSNGGRRRVTGPEHLFARIAKRITP